MELTTLTSDTTASNRDALIDRLLSAVAGTFDTYAVYLGDQLGFYAALAEDGPQTAAALARRTKTHQRYVREWLEQQAVAGIVAVEDAAAPADARRFYLPPGHAEVLADPESLNFVTPLAQVAVGAASPIRQVQDVYRHGGGVTFGAYGPDLREGQARMNRALFLYELGPSWLPAIPDVHARLQEPGARVADIGCGCGWSSIGMAEHYPTLRVDGYDLDAPSIQDARVNAELWSVADRVTFHVRDAGDADLDGHYDLVTAFECIHDLADPVAVLRTMRRLVTDDGAVLVMDERVADAFTPDASTTERLMYGFSILHCLPAGMAEAPSAETGTVMRADTLRQYAREAGFRRVEVLPIDNFFFRFYRLHT